MVQIIRAAMGYAAIPAGFPILVSERMTIIEPAFAWLMELATIPGRSHAAETVRTYGAHLHDWFDSLEQTGLDWRGVSETEIATWRNRMLSHPSPHTKRPYARSVNDRVPSWLFTMITSAASGLPMPSSRRRRSICLSWPWRLPSRGTACIAKNGNHPSRRNPSTMSMVGT